jgi:hypothetical protein
MMLSKAKGAKVSPIFAIVNLNISFSTTSGLLN